MAEKRGGRRGLSGQRRGADLGTDDAQHEFRALQRGTCVTLEDSDDPTPTSVWASKGKQGLSVVRN